MFACITPALAFGGAAERTPVCTFFFLNKMKLLEQKGVARSSQFKIYFSKFFYLFKDANFCRIFYTMVHVGLRFYSILDLV